MSVWIKKAGLFALCAVLTAGCSAAPAAQSSQSASALSRQPSASSMQSEADEASEAQTKLASIALLPAESAIDPAGLNAQQIRSCFQSRSVDETLVEQMDGDFYASSQDFITPDQLRLVRVLYTDFDGNSRIGELIVNSLIAPDIEDIFYTLYENGYPIDHVHLPFGYYADDNAIMADDITRALGFTWQDGTVPLEHEHSLGLAVDFNPLYNPQVITNEDGTQTILPPQAAACADRSRLQPHMMSEDDLAVQLFESHGFTWGGIWQGRNDYQHFEKDFNHDTGHIDPSMG